ncbi:MAG: glycogen/starch synthase, partial [Bacteroidales bacterium]|nr:glycogen/starch synthase [Bacteroidales bacterium]
IRLSGMNLIISDTDHPLIIKVASIQPARMQVYFIDNEDYFGRKFVLKDKKGQYFADNDERAIFYARGIIETVKKLVWAPDIVHCHGWFSGLTPLFLRKLYADDPLFGDIKIIYSIYDNEFKNSLDKNIIQKLSNDGILPKDVEILKDPNYVNFTKMIIDYSDGFIFGSEKINPELDEYIRKSGKPFLEYQDPEDYIDAYNDFYDSFTK